MTTCANCGSYGHTAGHCPVARLQQQRDPFGNRPRPKPQPISDPAMRDANEHTLFLNPEED